MSVPFRFGIVTGPDTEPVTVAEVKTVLHIDTNVEDDLIGSWIVAGRELCETYQRRAYYTQTLEMVWDSFPEVPFCVPRPVYQAWGSFRYTDYEGAETEIAETDFIVDTGAVPALVTLEYGESWPSVTLRSIRGVVFTWTAGHDDVADISQRVKDAIFLYCAYRNECRAGETGAIPENFYHLLNGERMYDQTR